MKKRISPVKVLLACIGCLLALVCAVYCVMMLAIPAFEGVDKTPVEGSADWMAALARRVHETLTAFDALLAENGGMSGFDAAMALEAQKERLWDGA